MGKHRVKTKKWKRTVWLFIDFKHSQLLYIITFNSILIFLIFVISLVPIITGLAKSSSVVLKVVNIFKVSNYTEEVRSG